METIQHFPRPINGLNVDHKQEISLLGSCFSTHLNGRLKRAGFRSVSNPFGVVFHPIALAQFISESLNSSQEHLLCSDDVWLSWDAGSEVYAMSEQELDTKIRTIRSEFKQAIERSECLIITLGSAHGYRLKSTGQLVANCHKQPGALFEKELTEVAEMTAVWQQTLSQLKERFPKLKVIFTISPVRYSRDGWVENNRSKARLFELVEQLQNDFRVEYFPAYELINDILRDYRYFEPDGVHPNQLAVDEVWKLFRRWYFNAETTAITEELEALRKMEEHRLLFPESEKARQFQLSFQKKRESFLSLYPFISW
ncbi:MAG: GSCFA domain-containing protein [Flavobacteriia bacterium]|nr:GSCFA domain-containing protein [Flavobacteriia bacterium]